MKKEIYNIKNISFSYPFKNERNYVFRGLDLLIEEASLVTIAGPSGSGKSTLLNLLGLMEPPQEGELFFLGESIKALSEKRKNWIRKFQIGFIFQQFHLFPVLSAEENVRYFLSCQKLSKKEEEERTEEALSLVGLWEHRKKRSKELSGGQQQRVAIARALAKRPRVILGDEPTGSLDQKTGKGVMDLLVSLIEKEKISVILTTHDPMVEAYGSQNIHLQDGILCGSC